MLGFNLYRSDELAGEKQKLNVHLIPAPTPGDLLGNAYQFADDNVISGHTYSYWLELVIFHGNQESEWSPSLCPIASSCRRCPASAEQNKFIKLLNTFKTYPKNPGVVFAREERMVSPL